MGKAGRDKGDGSMSELDGFVVYRLDEGKGMYISASPKQVRISAEAYRRLGSPEYVNAFFDESKKRVMLKKADKRYQNAMHCICHSAGRNMSVCYRGFADKVMAMFGTKMRIHGHQVGDDAMIFDKAVKR